MGDDIIFLNDKAIEFWHYLEVKNQGEIVFTILIPF